MKISSLFISLLGVVFAVSAATAQAGDASADVDLHVSTLGGGAAVTFPVGDSLGLRVGFNTASVNYSTTNTTNGYTVAYDGHIKLSTYELLADWQPFGGWFHLTGGAMINNNKIDAVGNEATTGGTINAAITFKKTVPYLGFGWSGRPQNSGFSFKTDFGVLFQGSPMVSLSSANATLQTQLAAQQDQLNTDVHNYKLYPVISIGVGYAF